MADHPAAEKRSPPSTAGIELGPGTGKFLFRIRQTHVAEHYAPLIARKAYGAVKLDLVLRAIALLPEHAGAREPGFVLWNWRYEHLHDLCKLQPAHRASSSRSDRATRHLKRKWVMNQMAKLVDLKLVHLEARGGDRPKIIVLRDDGSSDPFDDPGERGGYDDRYVTIRGSVIATGTLARWTASELAAYLAAIYAEYHQERGGGRAVTSDGTGRWWRQLAWFNNRNWHPLGRALLPFSKSLLEDGFNALARDALISREKIQRDPRNHEKFETPRVLYHNRFSTLDAQARRVKPDRFAKRIQREADAT